MRCAIYARVSTEGQREQQTIAAQLDLLPAHAEKMGWQVIETYVDDGASAESIEGRPACERLLQDAKAKKFEILLVTALNRITRSSSSAEGGFIYDTLRDAKIRVATPSQVIDLEDDEQSLVAGITREFARYEKLKIRTRTRLGTRYWTRQGKLTSGGPP